MDIQETLAAISKQISELQKDVAELKGGQSATVISSGLTSSVRTYAGKRFTRKDYTALFDKHLSKKAMPKSDEIDRWRESQKVVMDDNWYDDGAITNIRPNMVVIMKWWLRAVFMPWKNWSTKTKLLLIDIIGWTVLIGSLIIFIARNINS